MMKHEIRTFAMKDGKIVREIYHESFKTAEEAFSTYKDAIKVHNELPEKLRKPMMVVRYAEGRVMTMQVL